MVVCFKLPTKGAAEAAVAQTTARKTERKKVPESFMSECRYESGGREEGRLLESVWSPGVSRISVVLLVLGLRRARSGR